MESTFEESLIVAFLTTQITFLKSEISLNPLELKCIELLNFRDWVKFKLSNLRHLVHPFTQVNKVVFICIRHLTVALSVLSVIITRHCLS